MKPKKHYQVKPKKTLSSEAKENVRLAQKYKIRNVSRAQDKTCNGRIKMKMKNKNIKEKTCNRRMKKETEKKKPSASLLTTLQYW